MKVKIPTWVLVLVLVMFVSISGVLAALQLKPEFEENLDIPLGDGRPTPAPTVIQEDQEDNEPEGATATVSGYVVSGGDTTPEGVFDMPRKFVYQIRKDNGAFVNVVYTAYPPSPVGDKKMEKIRLDFHTGNIRVGVYLKARGVYDKETNSVVVVNEGDYIESYAAKP